jgi:lambda repressor-like predicted transcriptional regulator
MQWMRAELSAARETASAFLAAYEKEGDAAGIIAAVRRLGVTLSMEGRTLEASRCLERAILEVDEKDLHDSVTFTDDRAIAKGFLAPIKWRSGYAVVARALIREALTEAKEFGHAHTTSTTQICAGFLQILCEDAPGCLKTGETLMALGRETGMNISSLAGTMFASWTNGRLGLSAHPAATLREAVVSYEHEGNRLLTPWYYGLVADLASLSSDTTTALFER